MAFGGLILALCRSSVLLPLPVHLLPPPPTGAFTLRYGAYLAPEIDGRLVSTEPEEEIPILLSLPLFPSQLRTQGRERPGSGLRVAIRISEVSIGGSRPLDRCHSRRWLVCIRLSSWKRDISEKITSWERVRAKEKRLRAILFSPWPTVLCLPGCLSSLFSSDARKIEKRN